MNNQWQFGTPMSIETCKRLEELLIERYGRSRVRVCIEVIPKAILKTIDNEEDAKITIENLEKAKSEKR